MEVLDLASKLKSIDDHWNPRLLATLNGQELRLAKLLGEFCWHQHDDADELFLVLKGELRIDFRDGSKTIKAGQVLVVPRGVEHRPVALAEVEVLLFEPAGTDSAGGTDDPRGVSKPKPV